MWLLLFDHNFLSSDNPLMQCLDDIGKNRGDKIWHLTTTIGWWRQHGLPSAFGYAWVGI